MGLGLRLDPPGEQLDSSREWIPVGILGSQIQTGPGLWLDPAGEEPDPIREFWGSQLQMGLGLRLDPSMEQIPEGIFEFPAQNGAGIGVGSTWRAAREQIPVGIFEFLAPNGAWTGVRSTWRGAGSHQGPDPSRNSSIPTSLWGRDPPASNIPWDPPSFPHPPLSQGLINIINEAIKGAGPAPKSSRAGIKGPERWEWDWGGIRERERWE